MTGFGESIEISAPCGQGCATLKLLTTLQWGHVRAEQYVALYELDLNGLPQVGLYAKDAVWSEDGHFLAVRRYELKALPTRSLIEQRPDERLVLVEAATGRQALVAAAPATRYRPKRIAKDAVIYDKHPDGAAVTWEMEVARADVSNWQASGS